MDKLKESHFISFPYSDNPVENKRKVDLICREMEKNNPNIICISPLHLFSHLDNDGDYLESIMFWCYLLIDYCKVFDSFGKTTGCNKEINHARKKHKPIVIHHEYINFKRLMEERSEIDVGKLKQY